MISYLWNRDPYHTPVYFIGAALYSKAIGKMTPFSLRLYSALLSLLWIPALFFLLRQLGIHREEVFIISALFLFSPFFLIYAQQAREYGLWVAVILFLLNRTLAFQKKTNLRNGGLFIFSLTLSIYTDLLTLGVWGGILVWTFSKQKFLKSFLLASGVGLVLSLPWIAHVVFRYLNQGTVDVPLHESVSILSYLGNLAVNLARVFWDLGYEIGPNFPYWSFSFLIPSLAVMGILIFRLLENPEGLKKHGLLIFSGLGIPFALIAMDIVLGGKRGLIPRYYLPTWISLVIMVGSELSQVRKNRKHPTITGLVILTSLGFLSSLLYLRSNSWWTTKPFHLADKNLNTSELLSRASNPAEKIAVIFSTPRNR
ncbi:hypothetical protein K2X30_02560 [bacterium]|nr:hypothetical protein [bacterium]